MKKVTYNKYQLLKYNTTNTALSANTETCISIGSVVYILPRQYSNQYQQLARMQEKKANYVGHNSLSLEHSS